MTRSTFWMSLLTIQRKEFRHFITISLNQKLKMKKDLLEIHICSAKLIINLIYYDLLTNVNKVIYVHSITTQKKWELLHVSIRVYTILWNNYLFHTFHHKIHFYNPKHTIHWTCHMFYCNSAERMGTYSFLHKIGHILNL